MPAGRPRKPTQLKALQGTLQKCRENKNEPTPELGLPPCPARFKGRAEEAFWFEYGDTLSDMGVMTIADSHALELLCEVRADHDAARNLIWYPDIMNGGKFYKPGMDDDGKLKISPYVSIIQEKAQLLLKLLGQFGLTPSSRANVSAVEKTKQQNPFSKFVK